MVCSLYHEQECSTTRSRIKIIRDEEFGNNLVSICIQCVEAYCMESCPLGALSRDEKTGAVLVDDKLCNGCEACIAACPLGAIHLDSDKGIVFKCDLCGGDPECAKMCTRETLIMKVDDIDSPARKTLMGEMSRLLSKV